MPAHLGMPANAPDLPADAPLIDRYGRVARDLRVSLTDRCNLRCTYCMPAEGLAWLPTEDTLTDDELARLIGVAITRLGISDVRFTGGELPLRRGLESDRRHRHLAHRGRGGARIRSPPTPWAWPGLQLAVAGLQRVTAPLDSITPSTTPRSPGATTCPPCSPD